MLEWVNGLILHLGAVAVFLVQTTLGKLIGGGAVGASLLDGLRRAGGTPEAPVSRHTDDKTRNRIKQRKKGFWIGVLIVISLTTLIGYLALDISGAADPKRTRTLELWEALTAILTPLFVLSLVAIDLRLRALDR